MIDEGNVRDRSLIKIYKDLMVTKRDLIDLRQSITHTINSIRDSDNRLKMLEEKRRASERTGCQNTHKVLEVPLLPLNQLGNQTRCTLCLDVFSDLEELAQHKKDSHSICIYCTCRVKDESLQDHQQFNCPEKSSFCNICSCSIKKKDLNAHMKVCGFRECFKCSQSIYVQAYAFHLLECGKNANKNMIVPCRRITKEKKCCRPLVLPECLVVGQA